ncbi:MAG TPA: hypothetical protein VKU01_05255 [Bryobacteraceae bacterium]|nr:hypothetical protein [Bryobacteraceae bacterium]
MPRVQISIHDQKYAQNLANLLQKDGSHAVVFVEKPDLAIDGIIVVDGNRMENLVFFEAQPERFVVVTRKDANLLARIWDVGVRHVVFEDDAPSTALLAVIAAELRISKDDQKKGVKTGPIASSAQAQKRLMPVFPEAPVFESSNCSPCGCQAFHRCGIPSNGAI